ncbi:MAG: type II toxin-antitoxin system Phd/YefM family antitoxin [Flavobacteriaceae bacterium]|jgi:PHD/YefM family antitoxin component YafN of YafNO toxin-antitoxin module|nr:type II toxin-antitoxin system Phd/YefM family antitoxin [Flavobacteriaceae bacterium]
MKTVTSTEFKKNLKMYAELADKEKILVTRGKGKAFFIVPVNQLEEEGYSSKFVKKILSTKKERSKKVNPENLWESIK